MRIKSTDKRYVILIFACLINLCIGSMYAWSSLSAPMAEELNADLSAVFSTANAVSFIAMIIGGVLNDKYEPRPVILTGGVMFGVGMFTCAFAQNVSHLMLSYGICLGLGMSFVYGCTISNTIKFFPDKRGLVGGLTTASYGISSVLFAPAADVVCSVIGARATFALFGVVFMVVICVGAMFMKKCPEGYVPFGYVVPSAVSAASGKDKTPGQMLKSPVFYVMLVMLTCGGTFGLMIISGTKGLAMNAVNVTPTVATAFVSVLCLFNTAGRLSAGAVSDKIGRINTVTAALVMAMFGLCMLLVAEWMVSVLLFAIGIMLVGVCFGTFMGVFPGFCTDVFGTKYNTVNYGIMWIGFSLAGIIGPMILAASFDTFGRYASAFTVAMALAVLGITMSVIYRKLQKNNDKER